MKACCLSLNSNDGETKMNLSNSNKHEWKKHLTHFSKIHKIQYFRKLHDNMRLQSF